VGLDALLSRLDRVQRNAHGWRADCPTGHKARGALSVTQGDSGAILLHCFAGCSAADVLGALGLGLADVMPERLRDESPEARRAARERFRLASAVAASAVLARESAVVLLAAHDMLKDKPLSRDDTQRLSEAVERIAAARGVLA
jgi:hypothetical protein